MAIVKSVQHSGAVRTSTLSGNIELNQGTGELLVRNGANVVVRTNSEGFTYAEPTTGLRRIRIGLNPADDTTVGIYTSKPTIDVIDELESEA